MYDRIREILLANGVVNFKMHGEEASFRMDKDGYLKFGLGEDYTLCTAPDIDSALDCLMDECDEDEIEIVD